MTKKLRQFFNFSRQGKVWYFKACAFVGAYKTGLFVFFFLSPFDYFSRRNNFLKRSCKVIKCSCQRKDAVYFWLTASTPANVLVVIYPSNYGNMDIDLPKNAACAFRKKFQFDNSKTATTIKRVQCSLYLGHQITVDSLPFTCLKQVPACSRDRNTKCHALRLKSAG